MTHTPTPWEVSGLGVWASSPWNARVQIATVEQFSPTNGIDSAANAALIVRAVNFYGALLCGKSSAATEREAFEAAYIDHGGMRIEDYDLSYDQAANRYVDDCDQSAWWAWQARADLSKETK